MTNGVGQGRGFVHMVFFWLKQGTPEDQIQYLIEDCKTRLGSIASVKDLKVGRPAGTARDVVDNSYDVSLVVLFENREGHDYYQMARQHIEFIERNEEIWERVQVYDMIPE